MTVRVNLIPFWDQAMHVPCTNRTRFRQSFIPNSIHACNQLVMERAHSNLTGEIYILGPW